ncbi:uncharacterized protein L969DRAFT_93224 [Mixia osmundae IAM 14324]|uniref:Terpene cyclase/mutase family member n=1 Tax=Mixia osmundae (strain CBS 9802 / IAM 14324 / JCM 22182 / KY 12970) TaxID=764103 RepID=G7E5Q8_MIXOS|nr:uncharacterized protein L969DRAFT_93224 [Mixia osmundae IAM 14324]KEI40682.1 hypothetical protein L969DRAFT_93224 [Mixia osmundae IAM 14324]GAA98168.1 hypothetical protein E5Q_04851 [Mixia osmundae IAM 14324]
MSYPGPGPLGATDPLRWRLNASDEGRHNWFYLRSDKDTLGGGRNELETPATDRPQSCEDKFWLGLATDLPTLESADGNPYKAAQNGFEFYKHLQSPDGHWAGEYGGPHFLIPGLVIACYVTRTELPEEWRIEIARYLANLQRDNGPGDQGWGIHIEAVSSVFGSVMNYVALRLLGVDAEEPMMQRARATFLHHGGASFIPSWGKFWLSVLNVHEWQGFNPTPPELWLLPTWLPMHPSKWWVHTRAVYIPFGYLSGKQFKAPLDALTKAIRQEIYAEPYSMIDWNKARNQVAQVDMYCPHSTWLDYGFDALVQYEKHRPDWLRQRGIDYVYKLIVMEDENTGYQTIGPVSKAMNMICRWDREGPDSEAFRLHKEKIRDFFWISRDGMMMTGTNGSQLWDAGFIGQAIADTGLADEEENHASALKLLDWLDRAQIRTNPRHYEQAYRHTTQGAWPFSTKEQGYTVSDCTAEGLKAVIYLSKLKYAPKPVSYKRLCDAVDVLLSLQNSDGGFGSYELVRGPKWLELANCAEVFGNIMVEYTYPECTTACLTALTLFSNEFPGYRSSTIERVSRRAIEYIHGTQRPDGSWFGSWAICFTYATYFAVESLAVNGETYKSSERVKRACDFILSKQKEDGGWGESYKSCETGEYVQHERSQVVNTSWAVLTLLTAKCPDKAAVKRGVGLIMARQMPDGSWAQEAIEGIFNKNCAISYPNYKFSWTIWALGRAWKDIYAKEQVYH